MSEEMTFAYLNDIAKRLHDPSKYGSASVMIGAGFSKNAVNLSERQDSPSWEELAREMYKSLYPKSIKFMSEDQKNHWEEDLIRKTSGKNSLKLAEEYRVAFGRNKLDNYIEEMIDDKTYSPADLHVNLLELKWDDVFTTNYDTLLERATEKTSVHRNYKVIKFQTDLPGSTHPRIIKLHGSIPDKKPYIISEEDYRTYPTKYAPLVNTVQQSMLETQLCLLGFSGDDPNFLSWIGWLRDNMGENTPPIYLCGIFSQMSEYESKVLESQNIKVVNLDVLVNNKSNNKYYDGIQQFIKHLADYGEETDYFKDIPLIHEVNKIDELYYSKMLNITEKIGKNILEYIALPKDKVKKIEKSGLDQHFSKVLSANNDIFKFKLTSNIATILRKGLKPLIDTQARQIEDMLKDLPLETLLKEYENHNIEMKWFELVLYLAEMYRIDSEKDKYIEKINLIKSNLQYLDSSLKNDYYVELSKYYISEFNYTKAIKNINKIDEDAPLEIQIRKSCLYSQVQLFGKAHDIIKKCSSTLAQRNYTEDKTAALISYINLCARSLSILDIKGFSDKEYSSNKHSLRIIINDYKDEFNNSFINKDYNKRGKLPGFNPNSHRYRDGTISREKVNLFNHAFNYILLQDYLCMPIFRDHKLQIKRACRELIETSENVFWKWSYIVRLNDPKLFETFFTRDKIYRANNDTVRDLFNKLIVLLDEFKYNQMTDRKIINQKNVYDVLSRLCINLDDKEIIMVLNKIYNSIPLLDEHSVSNITVPLERISYLFNSNILEQVISNVLKESSLTKIYFSASFQKLTIENMNKYISEEIIFKIIEEIKSNEAIIRDKGLSKYFLLENNDAIAKYSSQFREAIWSELDKFDLPKSYIYLKTIWKEPDTIPLHKKYLLNPEFTRNVNENMITSSSASDYEINAYINSFYIFSIFNQDNKMVINLTSKDFNQILRYIYDYLQNEKILVEKNNDFMGGKRPAILRFSKLSELVTFIAMKAKISKQLNNDMEDLIEKIKILLKDINIPIISLETFDELINNNWDKAYKTIMRQIISGSLDYVSQAFISLEMIIIYKEWIEDSIEVNKELENLILALKYIDVKNSKNILIYLRRIVVREIFLNTEFNKLLAESLGECYEIYTLLNDEITKDHLDAIYNLSNLTKAYYNQLKKQDKTVGFELSKLIKKLKNSSLLEVSNIWNDITSS